MWSMQLLLLLAMTMKDVWHVSASQPAVTVGASTVYGSTVEVGDTTVNQFLGVRFGQPPVGPLRFSKPMAAPLPDKVNATTYPRTCPGMMAILPMDEDCLFLNLYVPQSSPQEGEGDPGRSGLPVMVWLYGGAFLFGAGSHYDGGLLAAEGNVIVVTPNYRVGPLGFLSTGDNSSVGNYGLWDQWLALNWVHDNIGYFGGDGTKVTLFGESAGGASVSYHMTSPHSQGLFHRAILQSGSRLCPWALDNDALSHAQLLGSLSSCSDVESTSALVSCLREKEWQSLRPRPMLHLWGPVVDGDFVLPFHRSVTFDGPFMIGVNNREGGMLLNVYKSSGANVNDRQIHFTSVLKTVSFLYPSLAASAPQKEKTLAAKIVDCVYRRNGSTDGHVTDEELEAFIGDDQVILGSQQFLDKERAKGARYLYYFDHYPDNIDNGHKGMDHAMDIDYTFGFLRGVRAPQSPFYSHTVSDRDRLLGKRFRSLLTNFARSGNPNQPTEIPEWPAWPPYTKGDQSYLSITFSPRVASHLKEDILKVWQETVPGLLRSQGPVGLNDTRWAHCADQEKSHSPAPSACVFVVVGASVCAALLMFM